jgi:glutaryl-CoA dehydrogenase
MSAIHKHGSEKQETHWLLQMSAGKSIGYFGLTEPTAGSDPSAMTTYARRSGTGADAGWILNGTKRWIGRAPIADVAIIWAMTDDGVRGFVVPTGTKGFAARVIEPKLSTRASIRCEILLTDLALPAVAMLPLETGLPAPFECLNEDRFGIIWGAMGAARDS